MNNIIRGIHLLKKAQKVCDGCESKPQASVAEKWLMLAYMQDWPAAYIKNAIFMLIEQISFQQTVTLSDGSDWYND